MLSLHTSPLDQAGTGDSGGMNVYVLEVAERLAEQGIEVDVYTRCSGRGTPTVEQVAPGSRIIQVKAGPCAPVHKEDLPELLPEFLDGVLHHAAADGSDPAAHRHSPYDVVHSHYWLSGWVGSRAKRIWDIPHVASFHTLGKVKNSVLPAGDAPEPSIRLAGEQGVVRAADRILAPTTAEADHLVSLYGADRGRIRIVPPGVDRTLFVPRPKARARADLHLAAGRLLLFVGRLQPFKGPDVAIRALAAAVSVAPKLTGDVVLAMVGGPSGAGSDHDEVAGLMDLAARSGVGDRVLFFPAQPHDRLADFYSAADVVLVPSRSESFGLVALEAEACGVPVVATATGGLRFVVAHGETGYLVEGHHPEAFAQRILQILGDPELAQRLSRGAVRRAEAFSWDVTTADVRDVYRELLGRRSA